MLLVFGSAKLLAEVFERLKQPGIVGEILAGVIIGPSVLGWLSPTDFLNALANLGAMFLLFRVGLDVKSSELIKVGGIATVVAKWGTATMRRVVPHMHQRLRVGESQFVMALVLLFALSVLAVWIGVAAIVGAFLAGMALAESVEPRVRDLAHGVTELLLPFFLAGIGLYVNLRAFKNTSLLTLALVVLLAALLSKFVGCGLGALSLGKADAVRIGVGMMPRGEVGMVVAQIGLTIGAVEQHVYSVVVFMP